MKQKVYAYVTYRQQLLVFDHHDFPEAGTQVPGGTVEPGEDTAVAAVREAGEETGLSGLALVGKVGEDVLAPGQYGRNEAVQRTFYHLRCTQSPPEMWLHPETNPSDGTPGPIWFTFYWVDLPAGVPELAAEMDRFVGELTLVD